MPADAHVKNLKPRSLVRQTWLLLYRAAQQPARAPHRVRQRSERNQGLHAQSPLAEEQTAHRDRVHHGRTPILSYGGMRHGDLTSPRRHQERRSAAVPPTAHGLALPWLMLRPRLGARMPVSSALLPLPVLARSPGSSVDEDIKCAESSLRCCSSIGHC